MIRKANESDIEVIANSYGQLLIYEKNNVGYSNWKLGVYPTKEAAITNINEGTMYVLEDKNNICASMILNIIQ